MGNNKGRSKGCVTCIRRRVKCDQTGPICTRCSKGKFVCEDYRETLFIDARDQVLRRLGHKSNPCHASQDRSQVEPSISNSALKNDQFLSYLVANFDGPMQIICGSIIAPNHQADCSQRTATKQCFLALATTFYGLGHASPSLLCQGLSLYTQALKLVNTAIRESPGTRTAHEAISSVAVLALHEAIAPTRQNGHSWLHHIDGLEQLFAIRGPIENDPVTRSLLEITRPMMIVSALYARRPTLMGRPEWSATIPISEDDRNSPTTLIPYLWDILAQIPQLYREKDSIDALSNRGQTAPNVIDDPGSLRLSTAVHELLYRSLKIRDVICLQRMQWKASHPKSELPRAPHTIVPSEQPNPFMAVLQFSSIQVANAFTLYQAVLILIDQFISALCPFHKESASDQIAAATTEILKSIDYHLSSSQFSANSTPGDSRLRNIYLLFPLRVAHRVLSQSTTAQDASRRLWLEDVLHSVSEKAGPWMSNKKIFGV